jgi:hypothetical protein
VTTVDDLLELPDDARYELINGSLTLFAYRAVHQVAVFKVCEALRENCPDEFLAVHQVSLAVDRHTELRPDVVVIRPLHMESPVPITDAVLAVDIVADAPEADDIAVKSEIYRRWGITYWVVDLRGEEVSMTRATPEPVLGVFRTDQPYPIVIDLPALTARRDDLMRRDQGAPK